MAISMVDRSNFVDGQDILAADWLAEIDNILNNFLNGLSPLTGNLDVNNKALSNINSLNMFNAGDPTTLGQIARLGTLIKYHDGAGVRVNQVLANTSQLLTPIANVSGEQSLLAFTLTAGYLGAANKVEWKILFRVGLIAGANVQIAAYYGGVLGPTIVIANQTGGTVDYTFCPLLITLSGSGTVATQALTIEGQVTWSTSNQANAFATTNSNLGQVAGLGVNATVDQLLQVNVIFSSQDSGNKCDHLGARAVLIG